jgi:hypothetical protein
MSDANPEQFEEFTTQDGPGSADIESPRHPHPEQDHPDHEAHGGSMAPQFVDDAGRPTGESPPAVTGR